MPKPRELRAKRKESKTDNLLTSEADGELHLLPAWSVVRKFRIFLRNRETCRKAVSAKDGKTISEQKLDELPVFDGMIAADKKLFTSMIDGSVVCLGERK